MDKMAVGLLAAGGVGAQWQRTQVRQELEQMVTEQLPVGVGALSWITLQLEVRGWGRFQNRRQVASYTGLCPGIHSSNGRGREGRINRCGNTIVRLHPHRNGLALDTLAT